MPTKAFGVVGFPVSHSMSPVLHRSSFAALGLDYTYERCEVAPGEFNAFIAGLDASWAGLSVTMPHKVDALNFCTDVDLVATNSGVVNTVLFRRDELGHISGASGYNTDVYGMVQTFRDGGVETARHGAIIGSGATASSAIVGMAEMGVEHISVIARNIDKATDLGTIAESVGLTLSAHSISDMALVDAVDIAICALPGTVDVSLRDLAREPGAVLLDVAYEPWPSVRSVEWDAVGGSTVSGLRMLVHQAVMQDRIFCLGDPSLPLPQENEIVDAMFHTVGLER